jgi:hypothetical protein
MAFRISDEHLESYYTHGYCVFRKLIPPTLLDELRVMAEKARIICHEKSGPQAQRLQPISKFDLDLKPYHEYATLPNLVEAIEVLFHGQARYAYTPTNTIIAGILFEPRNKAWCTVWHRDWRDNAPGIDINIWADKMLDWHLFNQVNTPLYDDGSTWVVPGSHLRPDLTREIERFPDRPITGPKLSPEMNNGTLERACLEYCESMPGAMQVQLHAGDFMLYRNSLWHIGNYAPSRIRATIHDGVWTPAFHAWFTNPPRRPDGEKGFMNPHEQHPINLAKKATQATA